MRLEGAGAPPRERRRLVPLLLGVVIVAGVVVPTLLYYTRGRKLPLRAVLEAERYVVGIGERVGLTMRFEPPQTQSVELTLSGAGASKRDERSGQFVAPTKIGLHTVTLSARASGTTVIDSITIRVVPRTLDKYKPLRPPAPPSAGPTSTPTSAPAAASTCEHDVVVVHGTPCAGCVVAVERVASKGKSAKVVATIHRLAGVADSARRGRVATLRIPRGTQAGSALIFETEIVRAGARCVQQRKLPVLPAPSLVADFRWQLISPSSFRLAARPPRSGDLASVRYRWRVDDGSAERTLARPRHAHRFEGARRRYRIVTLTITRGGTSASATRALVDRTAAR